MEVKNRGRKGKSSLISLPLLIPVLLDVEVPLPVQVDVLVVVDEAGMDPVVAT